MKHIHFLFTLVSVIVVSVPMSFAQEPKRLAETGAVWAIAFSPVDNDRVASAGEGNTIKIWNLKNDAVITLKGHTDTVNTLAFSPDGGLLVSGGADWVFKLWDVHRQRNIATLEHISANGLRTEIESVAFSPDGQVLATAGYQGVKLWDVRSWREIATLPDDAWVNTVSFSPRGDFLATGDSFGIVKVFNIGNRRVIKQLVGGSERIDKVVFSPDGSLLASSGYEGEIQLWQTSNWEHLGTLHNVQTAFDLEFSPDGKFLASTGYEVVNLWSVENGDKIQVLTGHNDWIHAVDFSPNGDRIVSGGNDRTLGVYQIKSHLEADPLRYQVRLIYFLPRGSDPQPDINAKLDTLIKEAQHLYADELHRHGFGRKTFAFEANAEGQAIVHHVRGQFQEPHYHQDTSLRVLKEISPRFSLNNVYLIVVETATYESGNACGTGNHTGGSGGFAMIPSFGACVTPEVQVGLAAHELGHAFGLHHDFSNDTYIMSYGWDLRRKLSRCSAEWLSVHPYLNPLRPGFNRPTQMQMLPLEEIAPDRLRFRFRISDTDGLAQAQLLAETTAEPAAVGYLEMIAYQTLTSQQSTATLVTHQLTERAVQKVTLKVIDTKGDFSFQDFPIQRSSAPGPKIEGPWLWVIAPTAGRGGAAAAASGIDYLEEASGGEVTEHQIATQGAFSGGKVGKKAWTPGRLAPAGKNNIAKTLADIGFGFGDIDNAVAYGSLTLTTSRQQRTTMFVGSDDAVKVWLNGDLVHNNPVDRGAADYQEHFPVTLKKGRNVLLVAVYEFWGDWSGFFGFQTGVSYRLLAPRRLELHADVNKDGKVNAADLRLVVNGLGKKAQANPRADVNKDGMINVNDLLRVIEHLDDPINAASPALADVANASHRARLRAAYHHLRAESDGSLKYQRATAFLESLLAAARPEKTALLANYPNPFNPETYIPYQLAKDSKVSITIYDTKGVALRTLQLRHQPAGIYESRNRAAYWDGRNAMGEPVASGVYFYTLTAGDFTATRKMLIRK